MKTKTRLTITLSQNLLKKVDALIDGHNIRSRSHAIENLVGKSLGKNVITAVVLAGKKRPKNQIPSLKKIDGRFVLSIMVDRLKMFGISRLVICAGDNESRIKQEFGDGSVQGIEIIYSKEKNPLGSAGAVKNAQELIGDETFVVINDSTLTDLDINDLLTFHSDEDSIATICVKPRMSEKKYGQVFLHGNKITQFMGSSKNEGISIVNMGLYVFKPNIFNLIKKDQYLNFETNVFPELAKTKELSAFVFQGKWFDVSKDETLNQVVKSWQE